MLPNKIAATLAARNIQQCLLKLNSIFPSREFSAFFNHTVEGFNIEALDIVTGRCDVKFIALNDGLFCDHADVDLTTSITSWIQDLLKEETYQ